MSVSLNAILREILRLTTRERLVLLEVVSRSLREDIDATPTPGSAERLLGIITTDHEVPDEEIDRLRFDHLLEKHS